MDTKKFIVEIDGAGKVVSQPVEYTGMEGKIVEVKKFIPYDTSSYITLGIIGVLLILFAIKSLFVVKQQSLKIIERLGKFKKVSKPGLNFKIPFIDRIAGKVDLRIQQLNVDVETKTKDNVFVTVPVAVQFFVKEDKAYESYYKLDNSEQQIKAYVFDTVRSQIPKMSLDEVFEKKEEIALSVKNELSTTMDDFGYSITTALVTDINPDQKVKFAMNEINAQSRLRVAATEKGEADKILKVKNAEAESESKKLQGEGISNQRLAIAKGFKESIALMKDVVGTSGEEIMATLLLTQYFDTMKDIGEKGNSMVFLPSSPEGMSNLGNELRTAILSTKEKK